MSDPNRGFGADEAIETAWKHREKIKWLIETVRGFFRKSEEPNERGILILGPGGTGKTTLARMLAGEFDPFADASWRYTESRSVETTHLHGSNPPVDVVTGPGQPGRRPHSWPDLKADLANGVYRGVILVVSYGYHTVPEGIGYQDHALYDGSKDGFLDRYLAAHRADERAILRDLTPFLQACRERVWLLTVVTKQDLWWDRRGEAERHYQDGEFAAAVAEVATGKGGRLFRHEQVYASLLIRNFDDGRGSRLAKNVAGYDQREQFLTWERLLRTVTDLKAWEDAP